ncbi:hypothetical protein ADL06_07410 [Streptomyces sp. NRRL F-6491]|nr:hypothetical protein ADL06_07410 [Streptomyces sp. NRRL F-6491]KOX49953.1 hypothetical protein ADL08_07620 [Streptomyces sp. NRRL F-6492]
MQGGDGLDGMVEAVASLSAVGSRQSRRIFQFFIRAKVCSTRTRTLRCSALSSSCPRRRGRPALLRCGTIRPVPR